MNSNEEKGIREEAVIVRTGTVQEFRDKLMQELLMCLFLTIQLTPAFDTQIQLQFFVVTEWWLFRLPKIKP
jgi:hypothetical protein